MRLALHIPHRFWQVLIALVVVTLIAVSISQCPSLAYEEFHTATVESK